MALAAKKPYDPKDHQYPKMKYLGKETHVVHSQEEETALGSEWFDSLADAKQANPEAFVVAAPVAVVAQHDVAGRLAALEARLAALEAPAPKVAKK